MKLPGLATAGADLDAITNDRKSTPLISAIASGARDAVLSLVRAGADVNLEADQGDTSHDGSARGRPRVGAPVD
jgi:ankyrin repeat protein